MNTDLKTHLKKAQKTAKRKKTKMDNAQIKAQEQTQIHDIRRLAFSNCNCIEVGAFQEVLSDPPALLSSDPINPINESNITARSKHLASLHANNSQTRSKNKNSINTNPKMHHAREKLPYPILSPPLIFPKA